MNTIQTASKPSRRLIARLVAPGVMSAMIFCLGCGRDGENKVIQGDAEMEAQLAAEEAEYERQMEASPESF